MTTLLQLHDKATYVAIKLPNYKPQILYQEFLKFIFKKWQIIDYLLATKMLSHWLGL
jgi:hypothetical protein